MVSKKNVKKKDYSCLYLCAPLAFVIFALRDIICGYNYPGYNWMSQPIEDFSLLQSHSFLFSFIFNIIFVILFIVSVICIFKYFKNKRSKLLQFSFFIFIIMSVVFSISSFAFINNDAGIISKVKEYTNEITKTETVAVDNQDNGEENSENQENAEVKTEEKTVIDEDATAENYQKLVDMVSENPSILGFLISTVLFVLLSIVSFILSIFGGFSKKGNILVGCLGIICFVLTVYSIIALFIFEADYIGIHTRIYTYVPILFSAIIGSYLYIINDFNK